MKNIYAKSAAAVGKIFVLCILFYLFLKLVFAENAMQAGIGLFVLLFITLPTIFVFFFKNKFLARHPKFTGSWKVFRVIYVIAIVLYLTAYCIGFWRLNEAQKTQKAIDFINSQKITLDDVMGVNLPSQPDQTLNNSTIAGIDANNNYIRDDVELAIFEKYPDSAKIRAAALQYAQAIQLELVNVFNSETLVATIQKDSNAYMCFGISMGNVKFTVLDKETEWIEGSIINTKQRKQKWDDNFEYMTTYSLPNKPNYCDVESSLLPN